MAIGLPVTKTEIDARSGDISRAFQRMAGDVTTLKAFLDTQTEPALVALGYTAQEVAVLKTGIADL
jgi:hypothetical protein